MKKLFIGLFVIGSFSSFAMLNAEFYDEQSGEISSLISRPSLGGGVPMSTESRENGVCKALGFERAAVGSVVTGSDHRGPMVIVAENGSVSGGEVSTSSSGYDIQQIICINKISSLTEKTFKISIPSHPDSQVPFSTKSSQNGVCKVLGFERAAVGSVVTGSDHRGPMVIVAENGSISGAEISTSSSGYNIEHLVCVNKI